MSGPQCAVSKVVYQELDSRSNRDCWGVTKKLIAGEGSSKGGEMD